MSEVLARFRTFAEAHYPRNGKPIKELVVMRYALKPVRLLYGHMSARNFGPLKLKAVQQYMIGTQDLSRGVINNHTKRIKRFFK